MNWKVVFLLCLVFFATTLVTSVTNTAMISLTSPQKMINASNPAILDTGFVEPTGGDPVDNPWAPH